MTSGDANPYLSLLKEVTERTARLVSMWQVGMAGQGVGSGCMGLGKFLSCLLSSNPFTPVQAVGFVHGVLNTDNMSILGVTIDFGPYGFMDKFNPMYTPNMTDFQGRR